MHVMEVVGEVPGETHPKTHKNSSYQHREETTLAAAQPFTLEPTQRTDWQSELLSSITSLNELVELGFVSADQLGISKDSSKLRAISQKYRLRIPRYYANLFSLDDPECPIRKQSIPNLSEIDPILPDWAQEWTKKAFGENSSNLQYTPWKKDAIGDLTNLAAPRLTHRYSNRAIVHVSSLCGLYCRFCFRKEHLNDSEKPLYSGSFEKTFSYLKKHAEIEELILTGGDPLTMTDAWFEVFFEKLMSVLSIQHLRIHSRMPVTLPSRLTEGLASILANQPFCVSLVSHFNHPKELTSTALEKLALFRKKGIALYNQSVLLAGINDSVEALEKLFQTLYIHGIRPFYLHHPDWTPGTFSFRLPIEKGKELIQALAGRVSGPALPTYVLDLPSGDGKVPLLDSTRVHLLETKKADGFLAALYRITPPQTRTLASSQLYLDLSYTQR